MQQYSNGLVLSIFCLNYLEDIGLAIGLAVFDNGLVGHFFELLVESYNRCISFFVFFFK